ncbi:hypothetical protein TCAL_09016 [Tigriopus californicus]|uniref:Major facilitator superfamily (MFS) profile domain-containing protein n=1 Tax=Tigriopus californicus TaxID=6832 RepID=A0A553PSM6_TIGCA|nr:MFS-type transporter SLC18B1-like isoform X1 [Tigriopus californicus]TRY80689.1 hypothetical protein TCAL_09016 [Tigriopus californicus]|eukprot:TCALIF_09016-PA protein Name:"Similar to SLC18B1 MFS-type transporter SLC18B1 (Homo sapiens)" AED:0.03 eAED:0.03 QI:199/0.85/0.75/1/0.57/0.5/8/187/434
METITRTRTILIAIVVAASYIDWGIIFSVQPAFYPKEAEAKGATPSQYGFVFGIVHLAAFVSAPIFAKYGNRIGPKLLYNVGALVQGCQGIAFGFLTYVDNLGWFLGLSYFLRALDGLADAAAWGAILSILMKMWPNKVASIMSWTELCFGLGYTVGPAIGSFLYSVGGFLLPFEITGGIGLLIAILIFFVIPNVDNIQVTESKEIIPEPVESKPSLTLTAVAKSPKLFMPYVDNVINFVGYGFVEAMIEPHLSEAGATQIQVGYFFLIMGALYMVTTPVIGYTCDHIKSPILVSILGNLCMAVAFVFVGPLPWIPIEPSVNLLFGMGAWIGFSYTFCMVSTFSRAHNEAMKRGYNDDLPTYLILSGLWSTSFYFGNFAGPTVGGFLVETLDFRGSTIVYLALYVIMAMVDVAEYAFSGVRPPKDATIKEYEEI